MRRIWTTHEGKNLTLELEKDEAELFERALKMYADRSGMDTIAQLYLSAECPLYRGRSRPEVLDLPVYQAIKDIAKRRGLEDGLLSDRPGSKPDLDSFKVSGVN